MALADHAVFGYGDFSENVTLWIVESEDAGFEFEANAILSRQPTDYFKTSTLSSVGIIGDRGSSKALLALGLLYTNATEDATFLFKAADSIAALTSGPSYTSAGGSGEGFEAALCFAGASDEYVDIPASPSLQLSTLTFECRVKPDVIRAQGIVAHIGATLAAHLLMRPDGTIQWCGLPGLDVSVISPSAIAVDEWTHIAGTYDGATAKLYLDGALVGTDTGSNITDPTSAKVELAPLQTNRFQGTIDDVRLWNDERSEAEINANKDGPLSTPLDSSLIGYWKLDEDSGTTAADETSNSNDGTLHGTTKPKQCYPDSVWASTGLDDYDDTHAFHVIPNGGVTARYFIVRVIDNANPDAHFRMGRLVAMGGHQYERNIQYGSSLFGRDDLSRAVRTNAESTVLTARKSKARTRFSLMLADDNEAAEFLRVASTRTGKDVLACLLPAEGPLRHDSIHYGRLLSWQMTDVAYGLRTVEVEITEL